MRLLGALRRGCWCDIGCGGCMNRRCFVWEERVVVVLVVLSLYVMLHGGLFLVSFMHFRLWELVLCGG